MSLDDERYSLMQMITQLERRIDVHEGKLEALNMIPTTLQAIDRRLWETERAMKDFGTTLDATSKTTSEIRDAQVAGRAVNSVGKWVGGLIIGLGAFWAAIKGFKLP